MKRYCKSICDGYLNDGDIFCREGEIYEYRVRGNHNKYPISVNDLTTKYHKMGWDFFHMFFIELYKDEMFDEKDFEI